MDIDPEDAFELANRNHQLCLKMKIQRSTHKNHCDF
jgi:hypothetical protein